MTTPAGWYPDPEQTNAGRPSTLRWWDGSSWTDDRTAAPDPSVTMTKPAQDPARQSQPSQQQAYGSYPSAGSWAAAPATQGDYGGGKAATTPAGEPLAGVGGRLVARIIDWVIVGVVATVLSIPFFTSIFGVLSDYLDEVSANPDGAAATDPFYLYRDPDFLLSVLLASLVGLLVSALYEIVFLRLKSATPGKMMLGMRVRRWDAPHVGGGSQPPLGWGTATGRWAMQNLPNQVLAVWGLVDSLWCTWDGKKQTLHDKVVGTTVVSVRR